VSAPQTNDSFPSTVAPRSGRAIGLAVVVAALGYFVDIYDLILFNVVRVKSLESLGLSGEAILLEGAHILKLQMIGMLLGGLLWGILGDLRGRLSVLFGSILLYSLANIANGMLSTLAELFGADPVSLYAWIRFIAGVGLAGELGAGITLVGESMKKENRGIGTTVVATVGICGAMVAVAVGKNASWQLSYFIGGGLGLGLLLLRIGVMESGLFEGVKTAAKVSRGNFFMLFSNWSRVRRYVSIILVGVPIWYVIGVLVTFAPELGKAAGMDPLPSAPDAVMASYLGLAIGDFGSGFLSQIFRNRRKILSAFLVATAVGVGLYFTVATHSIFTFYAVVFFLGIAAGYWAVFVTTASELFGTNLRATVTTTAPNFVRGAVALITPAFLTLRTSYGATTAALSLGVVTLTIAFIALRGIDETFGRDLNFVEE